MKVGDLVRVDYGESGFGPPCIFLGWVLRSYHSFRDPEWMNLLGPTGKKVEVHVDYIYRISKGEDK
tara:strand:+ start:749 stop:946 length:198 start_codon:yes stop_codon:yes gene_type:complete